MGKKKNLFHCGIIALASYNPRIRFVAQYISDCFNQIENGWDVYSSKNDFLYCPDQFTGDKGCDFNSFLKAKGYTEDQFFDKWLTLIVPLRTEKNLVEVCPNIEKYIMYNSLQVDRWVGIHPNDQQIFDNEDIKTAFRKAVYIHGLEHNCLDTVTACYTQELKKGSKVDVEKHLKYLDEHPGAISQYAVPYGC